MLNRREKVLHIFHFLGILDFSSRFSFFFKILNTINFRMRRSTGRIKLEDAMLRIGNDFGSVLIVGLKGYNAHYPYYYLGANDVSLCDPSLDASLYPSRFERYSVGMQDLTIGHKIDFIHFTGVYGWGIDAKEEMKKTVEKFKDVLSDGGIVLLAHNIKRNNPLGMHETYNDYFGDFEELRDDFFPVALEDFMIRVFRLNIGRGEFDHAA
jgi:hypothetical protein